MWITANNKDATEINDSVILRVLNLYPEEKLETRPIFQDAFINGRMSFADLKSESEKILIPWQMFFLTEANLNAQMIHIDTQRAHKVSPKLVSKRKGKGDVTSKRIIDRLIRQQNFLKSLNTIPRNLFCGSLKGAHTQKAVLDILSYFDIDRVALWRYSGKGTALEYLIRKIEAKNINVSRGVLTNKLLPNWQVVASDVYRSTSGFVIKDDCVPFVFLPSEINPDEVESRQIYTLVYLLVIIGLGQYDYFLSKNFTAKMIGNTRMSARIHNITSELLMPREEIDKFRGQKITIALRDNLADKFKVSPSALAITLLIRGIITKPEYEALKPPPFTPKKRTTPMRSPKISTSVEKFCGQISYSVINSAIQKGTLPSIQAQYLIFGAVNKKGYRKYRNELSI